MRARDGGAALCFALIGPLAYSLHWYQGHRLYLGPLHCHESLGFLVCGALIILQAAPVRLRQACLLAAACAGPLVFAFHFEAMRELSDLRSAPQRAARSAPPGAVILYVMGSSNAQDELSIKYYSPSLPSWRPDQQVFVREPQQKSLQQALLQSGLSGRPVYRWVPDPSLRSGRLEPVPQL
jgi:hypothetical protein